MAFFYFENLPQGPIKEDEMTSTEQTSTMDAITVKMLFEKLNNIQEGIKELNVENGKRVEEIRTLAKHINLIDTEDESTSKKRENPRNQTPTMEQIVPGEQQRRTESEYSSRSPSRERRQIITGNDNRVSARDIIGTIDTLNGKDDCGVEDFIKLVKKARKRCSQEDILLDLIISQKITELAKRAIRFISIVEYEDLYTALRHNVGMISSVESSRCKLEAIKQSSTESVQNFNMRFRQTFNELNYAIQNEHSNVTSRRLALQTEEKSSIKRYIMNLKEDIGIQVRPLKPLTLMQAQQDALESEIWYKERNISKSRLPNLPPRPYKPQGNPLVSKFNNSQFTKYPSLNNPPNHSMPLQNRMQLFCKICKKAGHVEEQCYSKQKNFQKGYPTSRPPERVNQLQVEENLQVESQEASHDTPELYDQETASIESQWYQDDCIQYEGSSVEQENQSIY